MENLVTLTLRSAHKYLLETGQGKFMVDAGWAGSLPALRSQLKRFGLDLSQVRYVLITHHHVDHAGLAYLTGLRVETVVSISNHWLNGSLAK